MKNLRVYLPLVNGSRHDLDEFSSGKALIHAMLTDDWGVPPRALVFEAPTDDGQWVRISIPYNADPAVPASASIIDEPPKPVEPPKRGINVGAGHFDR